MDKMIQQNAAGAEESASAAEEMNAQAESMKGYVRDIIMLVHGGKGMKERAVGKSSSKVPKAVNTPKKASRVTKTAVPAHPVRDLMKEGSTPIRSSP